MPVFRRIQQAVNAGRFFTDFSRISTNRCAARKRIMNRPLGELNIAAGEQDGRCRGGEDAPGDGGRRLLQAAAQRVHGDADRILPISTSGPRTAKLISGARLVVIEGGPHCIPWTHAQEVNAELLKFLGAKTGSAERAA